MRKIRLFCISLKTNTDKINSFFFNFHTPCWQQLPCQHDFFILSPRCETGVCRTGLSRPPDTLQYPFPLQHVPDATLVTVFLSVKVSLSSRVSDYLPPVTHAGVPLTLFLLLLRFLVWSALLWKKIMSGRQMLPRAAHCSTSSYWMSWMFLCPSRYF